MQHEEPLALLGLVILNPLDEIYCKLRSPLETCLLDHVGGNRNGRLC